MMNGRIGPSDDGQPAFPPLTIKVDSPYVWAPTVPSDRLEDVGDEAEEYLADREFLLRTLRIGADIAAKGGHPEALACIKQRVMAYRAGLTAFPYLAQVPDPLDHLWPGASYPPIVPGRATSPTYPTTPTTEQKAPDQ